MSLFGKKKKDKSKVEATEPSGNRAWRRAQAKAERHKAEYKLKRQKQMVAKAHKDGAVKRVANRIKKVKARIVARKEKK